MKKYEEVIKPHCHLKNYLFTICAGNIDEDIPLYFYNKLFNSSIIDYLPICIINENEINTIFINTYSKNNYLFININITIEKDFDIKSFYEHKNKFKRIVRDKKYDFCIISISIFKIHMFYPDFIKVIKYIYKYVFKYIFNIFIIIDRKYINYDNNDIIKKLIKNYKNNDYYHDGIIKKLINKKIHNNIVSYKIITHSVYEGKFYFSFLDPDNNYKFNNNYNNKFRDLSMYSNYKFTIITKYCLKYLFIISLVTL
jgi:hypothetical protein